MKNSVILLAVLAVLGFALGDVIPLKVRSPNVVF